MTPPGGSRDDAADDDPHGEAARDAADDASDPQLRAMRAVWLAMRDEDPPDRGLADVLAAARHKAKAMQPRPSAWQRLLAALRRPPVLALATVTVLIAGAVLIGRRVPNEAAPRVSASREEAAAPRSTPLDPGISRTKQAADRGGALAVPAPQPAAPPPAAPATPPDRGSIGPAPPTHSATTPSKTISTAKEPPSEAPRNDDDRTVAGAAAATPPPPADLAPVLGDGNDARTAAPPARPDPPVQPSIKAANPVKNGVLAPPPPRSDTGGDLYQQCEAAAQRGDCATVRRLVSRITRTDRGYRARVTKDSSVGKCLAE